MMLLLAASLAHAATLMLPISGGAEDGACYRPWGGGGYLSSDGDDCYVELPVTLPSGTVISSISVYYFDYATSCSVTAYLKRYNLSSITDSTISSASSTSSSSSVRSLSLTGTTLSSSYTYGVRLFVNYSSDDECGFTGVKINY